MNKDLDKRIKTTCPYCGVGCGVTALVGRGRLVSVAGDDNHPANNGALCVKGRALAQSMLDEQRLLYPSLEGVRISWDNALDTMAGRIGQAIDRYGPDSIALYLSGQLLTEDYYVANKLMKGFIGSANVDTNSRLCMSSAVEAHKRAFGSDCVPGSYDDLDQANLLVVVGSNAAWTHPILFRRMRRARQLDDRKRVVVIDPRATATTEIADLHLPLAPGTDTVLFCGLVHYLIQRDRVVDHDYIKRSVEGFADLADSVERWSIPQVAKKTALPDEKIEQFYDWFERTQRTVTFFSQGINQSTSGTDKANAIINCHLLTGRIGKPGATPFSVTGQPNAMGGREVGGLANTLAAHLKLENSEHREWIKSFWGAPNIADREGLKAIDLFQAMEEGRIKFLWIMGTNPLVSLPDTEQVRSAIARVDFVVVSDIVQSTDTMEFGNLLLPAASWGEKSGTVTNSERRITRQRRLLPTSGEARADWWIVSEVAKRLGWHDQFGYQSPYDIFTEHARLSGLHNNGSRSFDISALAELTEHDYEAMAPVQWPVTDEAPTGTERVFSDGRFFTKSGKARLIAVTPNPAAQIPTESYPYLVNSGRLRDQWHSMSRTGEVASLLVHQTEPYIEVHPDDLLALGLESDEFAELRSPQGAVIARVKADRGLRIGTLFFPIHWNQQFCGSANVGRLYAQNVDPISGQPEFKQGIANLRALNLPMNGALFISSARNINVKNMSRLLATESDYWSRVSLEKVVRFNLAFSRESQSWASLWDSLLENISNSEREILTLNDPSQQRFSFMSLKEGKLDALLWIFPHSRPLTAAHVIDAFARDVDDREDIGTLLYHQPPDNYIDRGSIICSCNRVGEWEIVRAIREGWRSTEALGQRLKCGTTCGSCLPELTQIIKRLESEEILSPQMEF